MDAVDSENIIKIRPIKSIEEYSYFIIKEAYKYVNTKYVLIIQCDGFILNPSGWRNDFLMYDYIGSPWWHYKDDCNVGNGGFSLRSRRLMEAVALDDNINQYHPEDFIICRTFGQYLKDKGFKFAPDYVACRFSIEHEGWDGQFGFHQTNISKWEIEKFTEKVKHAKYIEMFHQSYG
jgi:hypothetical protein